MTAASAYRHECSKAGCILGADAAVHNLEHLLPVLSVDGERQLVDNADSVLKRMHEAAHDDSWVQIALQKGLRDVKHFARCKQSSKLCTDFRTPPEICRGSIQIPQVLTALLLTQYDDRRCAVSNLLVLCATQFNDGLQDTL